MNIKQRLARVERQNRIFKGLFTLAGVAVAALIFYGATKPIPDVIQARKFEVVNEAGRAVVRIKSWELGGRILTYPATGKYWPSVELAHSDNGNGLLTILNKDGKELISAGADKVGDGLIQARKFQVVNEAGREVVVIESWEFGGRIATYPAKGEYRPSVSLSHDGSGHGLLSVYDKDGNRKIYLGGNKHGNGGAIFIINEMGAPVVQLHADEYGNGMVGAYNRKGVGRTLKPGP